MITWARRTFLTGILILETCLFSEAVAFPVRTGGKPPFLIGLGFSTLAFRVFCTSEDVKKCFSLLVGEFNVLRPCDEVICDSGCACLLLTSIFRQSNPLEFKVSFCFTGMTSQSALS